MREYSIRYKGSYPLFGHLAHATGTETFSAYDDQDAQRKAAEIWRKLRDRQTENETMEFVSLEVLPAILEWKPAD